MYGLNPQLPFNFDWPTSPIDGAQGATLVDLWQAQVEWVEKVGIISVPIVLMNIPALFQLLDIPTGSPLYGAGLLVGLRTEQKPSDCQ